MCKNNLTKELKNQNLNKIIRIFVIFIAFCFSWNTSLFGQEKIIRTVSAKIKPALNAYSFHKMLLAKDQNGKPTFTIFDLIDCCAEQNIEGIDVTGYYFPGCPEVPSDKYINMLKLKAFLQGIEFSGTGIKNNFASPDPKVRAADVELAKNWIEVASKLGAPVIRLFAGKMPEGYENKWDEVAKWVVDCL